jgi:Integrase core domain
LYSKEDVMEILEAFDLTNSYRAAGALCGVDHHTVAAKVAARAAGLDPGEVVVLPSVIEPFIDKIIEWVKTSEGLVRADVVHRKLLAMNFPGSDRTTRRTVAVVKAEWRRGQHRIYRPWIAEPGLWLQWDYGDGPIIDGTKTVLFVAWLAWSRFRVVIALTDKTLPTIIGALDTTFRLIGGVPTYALTDNERTVTDRHIAGIAVRNRTMVDVSAWYGLTIATCVPYDPESKGGSESSVKLAKADLVPTGHNLLPAYQSFAELETACTAFMAMVNGRVHRETCARPVDRLAIEQAVLHPVSVEPFTAVFGVSRSVTWSCMISWRNARYSVPHEHADTRVWVREHADQVIVTAISPDGPSEVCRHGVVPAGQISVIEGHYPPRRDPFNRPPRATKPGEAAFLRIGAGAAQWLTEAAGSGVRSIEVKMADAVALCSIYTTPAVDTALGVAAVAGRFAERDLLSILSRQTDTTIVRTEIHSLQPGTSAWERFGR